MRNYSAGPWYNQGHVGHLDLDQASSANPVSISASQSRMEAYGRGSAIIAICMVQDQDFAGAIS